MPNPTKLVQIGKQAEKFKRLKKAADTVTEVEPKELKIPHPLNQKEVFTFPPGTDPVVAKEFVRQMLLAKSRKGNEVVELPSALPAERVAVLEEAEKELERAKRTIKDLESRKDLTQMEPGTYYDENTGDYYQVTSKGLIKKLSIGETPAPSQ